MSTLLDINSPNSLESASVNYQPNSVALKATEPILTAEEIQQILPHRYPFSLVDRIVEYVPGKRAVGIKNVTFNEPHFQGHFPGKPMMSGVMIVEAMAQVCGVVLTQLLESEGGLFLFAGIDKAVTAVYAHARENC